MALSKADKEWIRHELRSLHDILLGPEGGDGIVKQVEENHELLTQLDKTVGIHSTFWKISAAINLLLISAVIGLIFSLLTHSVSLL